MKPLLVLNFKAFQSATGSNAVRLARISESFARKNKTFQVVVCPSFTDLPAVSKVCSKCWVFSQHVDDVDQGAFTGSFPVLIAAKYCSGTLLNHSERKIPLAVLKKTIALCRKHRLKTLVCAETIKEAKTVARFSPSFLAVEPPDLIGSGISISTAKPQLITTAIGAVKKISRKLPVLVGAGVSTAEDVRRSLELGADGVLVASAFAKNKNPKKWLASL